MAEREYRILARVRFRPFMPRFSMWLGRDHLLSIESQGFHERYRRFYFRDIQSIAIRGTPRRATLNWALSGSLLLFLLLMIAAFRSQGRFSEVVTLIAVVSVGIPLAVNNILGPACDVYVRTAVQLVKMPALRRIGQSRKILDHIRPLIVAAQEAMTPHEVMERLSALQSGITPAPPLVAEVPAPQQMDQIQS